MPLLLLSSHQLGPISWTTTSDRAPYLFPWASVSSSRQSPSWQMAESAMRPLSMARWWPKPLRLLGTTMFGWKCVCTRDGSPIVHSGSPYKEGKLPPSTLPSTCQTTTRLRDKAAATRCGPIATLMTRTGSRPDVGMPVAHFGGTSSRRQGCTTPLFASVKSVAYPWGGSGACASVSWSRRQISTATRPSASLSLLPLPQRGAAAARCLSLIAVGSKLVFDSSEMMRMSSRSGTEARCIVSGPVVTAATFPRAISLKPCQRYAVSCSSTSSLCSLAC
mmetsp:Transcript_1778/g.5041  ORF Transcript_1778/g.5041 Transcript_1778/m.5041 type:complete len:277 (-) Transcript_1778:808-1638(-)